MHNEINSSDKAELKTIPMSSSDYLSTLQAFTSTISASTSSFWIFLSSTLKKMVDELKIIESKKTPIEPEKILGLVIHNTLTDNDQVLDLLKQPGFKILSHLISTDDKTLTYSTLKRYAQQHVPDEEKYYTLDSLNTLNKSLIPEKARPPHLQIIDGSPEQYKLSNQNTVTVVKNIKGYDIHFYDRFNQYVKKSLRESERLALILADAKPGLVTDPNIRNHIFDYCVMDGFNPHTQTRLISIFQNILYWTHQCQSNLVKKYQLPALHLIKKLSNGMCHSLPVANTTNINGQHEFSKLLCFLLALDLENLQLLVKEGLVSGYEDYPLEKVLEMFMKIYRWQNASDLGIMHSNEYRTGMKCQWINTITIIKKLAHLSNILENILVDSNLWEVFWFCDETGSKEHGNYQVSHNHFMFIKKNQDGRFWCLDSNYSVTNWFGPFENIKAFSQYFLKFYSSLYSDKNPVIGMTANSLQYIQTEDLFDSQVAIIKKTFEDLANISIDYLFDHYITNKICQTEFARTMIPALKKLPHQLKLTEEQSALLKEANQFFENFLRDKHSSSNHFVDKETYSSKPFGSFHFFERLIDQLMHCGGSCGALAVLKMDPCGDSLFGRALQRAVEYDNFAMMMLLIQNFPIKQNVRKIILKDILPEVTQNRMLGALLSYLETEIKSENDTMAELALFAVQNQEYHLLKRCKIADLESCLEKINAGEFKEKQTLFSRIESAFLHQLDNRYPLTPPGWTAKLQAPYPNKQFILTRLTGQQQQEYAGILKLLGYSLGQGKSLTTGIT